MPKYDLEGRKLETSANPPETLRPDRAMIDGSVLDRVPRRPENEPRDGPCPDCGARPTAYHKVGCGVERCPSCGGKLQLCECEVFL